MNRKLSVFIVLLTLVLAACAAPRAAPGSLPAATAAVEAPAPSFAPQAESQDAVSAGGPSSANRLVITNVNLSMVVNEPSAAADRISQLAESMGGFVVSLNMYETTYGPEAKSARQVNMTIRVPSQRLNEALDKLKGLAVEVKSESRSSQDVTAEYTDLESRLRNLEAAEKQLQSIMDEARKTEDVLAVYNQLVSVREQIEVIKGQMKFYKESAALSAVSIDLIPNVATKPIEIGGWRPEGTAKKAVEDLIRVLQNLADFLIYFGITCLPFLLVLGLPAVFGARYWLRRRKNKAGG